MNHHTRNGLVGFTATIIPNSILRLTLPDIFSAPFSGSWWYMWFPIYAVWLGLLVIGLACHAREKGKRDGDNVTGSK